MEKSYEQKKEEVLGFFKDSFCVDGDVQFASVNENETLNRGKYFWVKLQDSKRGTFFITTTNQAL